MPPTKTPVFCPITVPVAHDDVAEPNQTYKHNKYSKAAL